MVPQSENPVADHRLGMVGLESGRLTPFEVEIVAVFADLVVLLGLPKSMGEIYGILFASAEPLTFVEIEQKLDLSKGSVSQGLRALRELGAISEAGVEPKDPVRRGLAGGETAGPRPPSADTPAAARSSHWIATTELRQLIGRLLRERLTPYLERQDQRVNAAGLALRNQMVMTSTNGLGVLGGRLEKLQTWQSRARAIMPIVRKML